MLPWGHCWGGSNRARPLREVNLDKIAGKKISILYDGGKCIHSRNCVLSLPDVFLANTKGDWIFPDAGSVEDIVVLARGCPSGAIRYERNDGGEPEPLPKVNTIRVMENGPLAVRAELRIDGADAGRRATLCRCGASKNKPYCDGSHVGNGFVATGEIPDQDGKVLEERDGVLEVTPTENGPLMVQGNLEVLHGSGRRSSTVTKAFFCRCGHSANKPYCDGSHKRVGFRSD
ncbi:MAG: iron-binding protein [Hyphomicrobiales bacterium]|nr:iron-binding protein [Hyphomicrobiales bacterium]